MTGLAIDLGSTQWKAALGDAGGLQHIVHMPAPFRSAHSAPAHPQASLTARHDHGHADISASDFADALFALVRQLPLPARGAVRFLSLTGMAEGGLLLDRATHAPLSPVVPWYDTRSTPACETLRQEGLLDGRYAATGLPASYKYGIFRLRGWLDALHAKSEDVRWLGVVEYAAFLLTGKAFTVPTFAARTYAYQLDTRQWDTAWLRRLGIDPACFPAVYPHGETPAALQSNALGLPEGIPVYIAGHDHLCAAYGAGALGPGSLYGSMGTAMTVIGDRAARTLSPEDLHSGLSFGPALTGGGLTALGSIQSAGGSVRWVKDTLYPSESYDALLADAHAMPGGPSGMLFFPYLSGSGAPHLNAGARGSFIGLRNGTDRRQLLAAVYEGIAMESRFILSRMDTARAERLTVSGGLAAHHGLLQRMADILGAEICVSSQREGTLYGALRLALAAQGQACPAAGISARFSPSPHSDAYAAVYRDAYLPLMTQLERIYPALSGPNTST